MYETIVEKLAAFGYTKIKRISSSRIAILIPSLIERAKVLAHVTEVFAKHGSYHDRSTKLSSAGHVVVDSVSILVKPESRQGSNNAGLANEKLLVQMIESALASSEQSINIVFTAPNAYFRINSIVGTVSVGSDTKDRKKSDVNLLTSRGRVVPLSIKQDNAAIWESADRYWGLTARHYLDKAIEEGKVEIRYNTDKNVYSLSSNLAIPANDKERLDVVFGSDIQANKGAIVQKTFVEDDFVVRDRTLKISSSHIIRKETDLDASNNVWFLIRNDATRINPPIGYSGLRVLAVYEKRVHMGNTVKLRR